MWNIFLWTAGGTAGLIIVLFSFAAAVEDLQKPENDGFTWILELIWVLLCISAVIGGVVVGIVAMLQAITGIS